MSFTKQVLLDQMNILPHRFCFIKCLKPADRSVFIDRYIQILNSDEQQPKFFEQGVIKVSTWITIMHDIEHEIGTHYCVYRNAYWGENIGNKTIIPRKVWCKSLLVEFGMDHICTVDLLIDERHISIMTAFRRSSFVNPKQWFWDKIIGYQ